MTAKETDGWVRGSSVRVRCPDCAEVVYADPLLRLGDGGLMEIRLAAGDELHECPAPQWEADNLKAATFAAAVRGALTQPTLIRILDLHQMGEERFRERYCTKCGSQGSYDGVTVPWPCETFLAIATTTDVPPLPPPFAQEG